MTEFTVRLANRPGQLAELTRRLADADVHVEALAAFSDGANGVVRLVATDETSTRRVLDEADLDYTEHRVITTVITDRPGSLAGMAQSLADSGVNIDAMYLLRTNGENRHFALAVSEREVANQLAV